VSLFSENERVSVVLMAYNEAETIEQEILDIQNKIISKLPGSELIIAEDGSTDGTKEIIMRYVHHCGVIHSTGEGRKGYAKALKDALRMAHNPYIFFSDTGNKFDVDDFWKLYAIRHQHSLVIGRRSRRTDQLYRRLLTRMYNMALKIYFRVPVKDADSGFRIYHKELIEKLCREEWLNQYLIGSELTLRTLFSGKNVGYVPVSYRQRIGASRGLPLGNTLKAILSVLKNFPRLKEKFAAGNDV